MRTLKSVKMFGDEWKVIRYKDDNKEAGGSFDFSKKTIKVNDRYGEFENIIIHEILEAVLLNNYCRFYGQEGSMEYVFHFDHTKFAIVAKQLSEILKANNLLK
jgi:hypothetical protein